MANIIVNEKDECSNEVIGYMFGVEYEHHLGKDVDGVKIYPSLQDLYESNNPHGFGYPSKDAVPQDGIVQVRIKFIKHIPAESCWEEKENESTAKEKRNA